MIFGVVASQVIGKLMVWSKVCSGEPQRRTTKKRKSSAIMAFCGGNPVVSSGFPSCGTRFHVMTTPIDFMWTAPPPTTGIKEGYINKHCLIWPEVTTVPFRYLSSTVEGICLFFPLQRCHIERGSVSNHRRLDCILNRLFRRRSKKTSKLRVTGLCEGNSPRCDAYMRLWTCMVVIYSGNGCSPVQCQAIAWM